MHMQAQRGGRGIAATHSQSGTRRWIISTTSRLLYLRRKSPGTHCPRGRTGLWACLNGTEYLASNGNRSPDRPTRSQSQFQLRYPSRTLQCVYVSRNMGKHLFILLKASFEQLIRNWSSEQFTPTKIGNKLDLQNSLTRSEQPRPETN